jgi:hypothetical protein
MVLIGSICASRNFTNFLAIGVVWPGASEFVKVIAGDEDRRFNGNMDFGKGASRSVTGERQNVAVLAMDFGSGDTRGDRRGDPSLSNGDTQKVAARWTPFIVLFGYGCAEVS